jgi:hypothetical protein
MTNALPPLPKESGRQGITGLASYLLGAVPLIFFVYVLMLADDYAFLRAVINQLSLGTLLVICIPLLPLWIAAAGILVTFALSPTTPPKWLIGLVASPGLLAGLFAWSTTTFVVVTAVALLLVVAYLKGFAKWPNIFLVVLSTVFILKPLFAGNPAQAARDVVLRGFPREVVFTAPGVYERERYDAYVLQSGDQVTTVVIEGDFNSPKDVIYGDTVINLRNDSILDRTACVPTRTGHLSLAADFFRQFDPVENRTPACASVLHPEPPTPEK